MSFSQLIKDPVLLLNQYRVIALQAPVYPALFVRVLLAKIKRDSGFVPMVLDVAASDIGQVKLRLSTSFLGQKCLYWFGDTSALSPKSLIILQQFLSEYQGEHTVLLYTQQVIKGPRVLTIVCPEKINSMMINELMALYPVAVRQRCQVLARELFKRVDVLALEQAVLLLDYASILGANRILFLQQWLDKLVKPETSLFQLSALLLAGDVNFWPLWYRLKPAYEFPFWVVYFSELFFRAYYYGVYRRQQKLIEAKKISYRLPFSFIQKDWQKTNHNFLCVAHARLTAIDYQLKNGSSPEVLDSVFVSFFV